MRKVDNEKWKVKDNGWVGASFNQPEVRGRSYYRVKVVFVEMLKIELNLLHDQEIFKS